MTLCLFILIGLFLLWMLYLFLLHPVKTDASKYPWLTGHTFAHRGLYTRDQLRPENSISAFRRAVDAGFGIEFDVHLTKDQQLAVFHDDNLKRMTGTDAKTEDFTYDELQELQLAETEEKIPLLADVLRLVDGRVPLILELKGGHDNSLLCKKVSKKLQDYKGDICVESFRPEIVRWFYKNAPSILRGQLSEKFHLFGPEGGFLKWLLGKLVFNCYARPQFISYNVKNSSLGLDLSRKMGALTVAWTVRTEAEEDKAKYYFDSYIFEEKEPVQEENSLIREKTDLAAEENA